VASRGDMAAAFVALYLALGGGWQAGPDAFVPPATIDTMRERTNWGDLLDEVEPAR